MSFLVTQITDGPTYGPAWLMNREDTPKSILLLGGRWSVHPVRGGSRTRRVWDSQVGLSSFTARGG